MFGKIKLFVSALTAFVLSAGTRVAVALVIGVILIVIGVMLRTQSTKGIGGAGAGVSVVKDFWGNTVVWQDEQGQMHGQLNRSWWGGLVSTPETRSLTREEELALLHREGEIILAKESKLAKK